MEKSDQDHPMQDQNPEQVNTTSAGDAAATDKPESELLKIHEGRIIIRNIPFDLKESHFQKDFAKFGKIIQVNVPLKNENNLNRGFAFVEYDTKEQAQKAIDALNGQKFKGRTIAVQFSVAKKKYETRVEHILENTKQTRQEIVQPKEIKEEKEQMQKAKEEKKEKIMKQKEENKKKKEQEELKSKKDNKEKPVAKTLFVRNIGYDTTEDQFREFMERFGQLKYALLVKQKDLQGGQQLDGGVVPHKGTGFVQFKDPKAADQLIEMSLTIESKLDEECKNQRLKQKRGQQNIDTKGVISVIQGELELNGRRLVIKEAMSKENAKTAQDDDKKKKQEKEDKRNLNYKKEGLLNEDAWIHKKPAPSQKNIEQRQRLLNEKEKSLSKNTNLFVAKTRITLRNLPKRDFQEPELKELMLLTIKEWIKSDQQPKDTKTKKFLKQVKILRDKEKKDSATGDALPSGMGFAEFTDESLALYAVRYLNNMELVSGKGLIVDFSLEDARKLHKREKRFEKQKKLLDDKKREQKQSAKKEQRETIGEGDIVDIGKKSKETNTKKKEVIPIDKITDLEVLYKMLRDTKGRGKKQRIKKRIAKLSGVAEEQVEEQANKSATDKPKKAKTAAVEEQKPPKPQQKVQELLKKREEKLKRKEDKKNPLYGLTDEDKQIMKKVKSKKNNKKRAKTRETDDFDNLLAAYKKKVLQNVEDQKKSGGGHEFEEIEMSDY